MFRDRKKEGVEQSGGVKLMAIVSGDISYLSALLTVNVLIIHALQPIHTPPTANQKGQKQQQQQQQ